MKVINFFMVFTSFALSAYWRSHLHIEPKYGFSWGACNWGYVKSNQIVNDTYGRGWFL